MRFLFFVCWFVALLGCNKEPTYYFSGQDLAGQIEGEPWQYGFALLRREDDTVRLRLYADSVDAVQACAQMDSLLGTGPAWGNRLEIRLPFADLQRLHFLHFNFKTYTGIALDFYSQKNNMNSIAQSGAVEITHWDDQTGELQGRMDVRYNKRNFVNGRFKANACW